MARDNPLQRATKAARRLDRISQRQLFSWLCEEILTDARGEKAEDVAARLAAGIVALGDEFRRAREIKFEHCILNVDGFFK